jgi:hypothetical protein
MIASSSNALHIERFSTKALITPAFSPTLGDTINVQK